MMCSICNTCLTDLESVRKDKNGNYYDTCTNCLLELRKFKRGELSDNLYVTVNTENTYDSTNPDDAVDYDSFDGWYSPEFGSMPE